MKETISDKQAYCLVIVFIWGSTIVIGTGGDAKNDMWFAVLLATVLGIIISTVYSRILYDFPDKDLFDINIILFGKVAGGVINLIYTLYALNLSSLVINNFTEFINTLGLPDTPRIVPVIFIIIICVWGVKEGIEVMGRCSEIFILILALSIFVATTLSINKLNVDYIRPFMYDGLTPVLRGTFSAFAFPFGETVIFLMLFSSLKRRKSSLKVYWISMAAGGIGLAIIALRNIMFIGGEAISKNYFPSYLVISKISIGTFLERIETILIVSFLLAGFIKVTCCILAGCKGISKILGMDDYRFIVTPICLMVFTFSFIVYNNIMETVNWAAHIYPVYAFSFQVILPFLIFIAAEVKVRRIKKKGIR